MARPRALVASRSIRPLRTMAGPPVIASRTHCQRRPRRPGSAPAAGAEHRAGAVGGLREVEQVGPFGVVELQCPGDRVQHGRADAGEGAALELGVVLDAHAGQGRDLAAAQARDPTLADVGQPDVARGELGAAGDEELADLGSVVHDDHGRPRLPARDALSVHVMPVTSRARGLRCAGHPRRPSALRTGPQMTADAVTRPRSEGRQTCLARQPRRAGGGRVRQRDRPVGHRHVRARFPGTSARPGGDGDRRCSSP